MTGHGKLDVHAHHLPEPDRHGSDFPYAPGFVAAIASERLDHAGDPPGSLLAALRTNTEPLFPQLAAGR